MSEPLARRAAKATGSFLSEEKPPRRDPIARQTMAPATTGDVEPSARIVARGEGRYLAEDVPEVREERADAQEHLAPGVPSFRVLNGVPGGAESEENRKARPAAPAKQVAGVPSARLNGLPEADPYVSRPDYVRGYE